MPFNAFQDQGNEPLSTLLSATANATALNFKLTDLVEAGVYDTLKQKPTPGGDRVAIVSTVHIAQTPYKEKDNWVDYKNKNPLPGEMQETASKWKESEVVLVDKNFNTLVDPRDKQVVEEFGEFSDSRRLYVVNEIAVQAIGAGDMTVTFFSQDPTVYGYEQVSIWEGRFRNYAKVKKSTRAWTTTIRFGQPLIKDEQGEVTYRYPQTILADIQQRPNLPPPPYEDPENREYYQYWVYTYQVPQDGSDWEIATEAREQSLGFYSKTEKNRGSSEAPIVWAKHLDHSCRHTLIASKRQYLIMDNVSYKDLAVYQGESLTKLVAARSSNSYLKFRSDTEKNWDDIGVLSWGSQLIHQRMGTHPYTVTKRAPKKPIFPTIPPLSTDWVYWHGYYFSLKHFLDPRDNSLFYTNQVESLWYSGLYKDYS